MKAIPFLSMIKRIVLGKEAVDWMGGQLSPSHTMAREILSDPPSGSVVTFAPEEMTAEELADFDGGCLGDTLETLVPVWEFAAAHLRTKTSERRYLICEYTYALKTDGFLARTTHPYFTYDDEVYSYLAAGPVSKEEVRETLAAGAYPSIAALTSLPGDEPAIAPHSDQPRDVLQALAHRAAHVLIGAYDKEGWLIWSRQVEGHS
jgi:hypothetical protein